VWVEILLDKFASYRPTQRLLEQWRSLGLDLAPGTITDGLRRLEPLFVAIVEALLERNRQSHYKQADESRWLVFVEVQGKVGFGWWLWAFSSNDTVVYIVDVWRSHRVPEHHYPPKIEPRQANDRPRSLDRRSPAGIKSPRQDRKNGRHFLRPAIQ